ncbi:hypothetical protein [Leptolyngbya sp. NIES-2104]|nr:hypothetical protein [Leptolyngbya sp. NIES-2104]GAP94246.1 hypothetical protein NIES2104_07570 [Leptolyngbya sp. NIES-2104]
MRLPLDQEIDPNSKANSTRPANIAHAVQISLLILLVIYCIMALESLCHA